MEAARARAATIRSEYKAGTDRRVERQRAQAAAVTLRAALDGFLAFKVERHKPRTQDDMRAAFKAAFSDWLDRPLTAISGDMALDRHRARTQQARRTQRKRGHDGNGARADLEMRYLRAVFRWARKNYRAEDIPVLPEPPTERISDLDMWNRPAPKQRTLEPETMPAWHAAVMAIDDSPTRDWLLFTWLTGLRSTEGRELRWMDVDFERGAFALRDPKNRQRAEMPITSATRPILEGCRTKWKDSEWVFPGATKGRPLGDNTAAIRGIVKTFGRPWSPHDCRAAFQTAGAQCRIHPLMVRGAANHKLPRGDAHATYFSANAGREGDSSGGRPMAFVARCRRPVSRQVQVAGGSAPTLAHAT